MRRRARATAVRPRVTVNRAVGAGVALAVPAAGGLMASAPALAAAPGSTTPTTTAGDAKALPVVAYGSRGDAVKTLQTRLGLVKDGWFGPLTLSAVKAYQKANGLDADGVVGPLTWAKMGVSGTAPSSSQPSTTPSTPTKPAGSAACSASATTLRYGMTSQLVKVLQGRLGLVADGWFGPLTKAKVVAYQSANGLEADGVVGPLTWAKLGCTTTASTTPTKTTPTTPTKTTPTKTPTAPTVPSTPSTGASSATVATILAYAQQFVGVPYVWGGSTPSGFDCSGLTSYVYSHFGYSIPRTAAQQQAFFTRVSTPQPGDLVFYGAPAYHVAIYLGNGMMLHAPHPGATVVVRDMYGTPSSFGRVVK